MSATRRQLHAVSLDYDNCFAHDRLSRVGRNTFLLQHIFKNPNPKAFLDASLRQDYHVNKYCRHINQNGDCFEEMHSLVSYLQSHRYDVRLNKLTLADVDAYLPNGFCFDRALQPDAEQIKHPSCFPFWDNSKLRILYAQMQDLASQNPNADIEFDFYDDRDEMLCDLFKIFTQYPALKPGNVKLNLHYYNGSGEPILVGSCDYSNQSTDYNWRNNTRLLGSDKYCINSGDNRCVNPLMIPTFLRNRSLRMPPDAHYREPQFAIEKNNLEYAISLGKLQHYKHAVQVYAGISLRLLPDEDIEQFYTSYATTLLALCNTDFNFASQYPEYNSVEMFKEKLKLEYICKIQKKLPEKAAELHAKVTRTLLGSQDRQRFDVIGYEIELEKRRDYVPPRMSSTVQYSKQEDGIDGQTFNEIVRNYKGSCLNCCGYFARSGTMKALRKLQNKDWVTVTEIEDAIRKDKKSNRRISIFRGHDAVDGSGTEAVLVELRRACNYQ